MLHEAALRDHGVGTQLATIPPDACARLDVRDTLLKSTPLGWACRWGASKWSSCSLHAAPIPSKRTRSGGPHLAPGRIEASREKVKALMERPLGGLRLCAVLIDGTPFKDRQLIVALGIGGDGSKTVLGLREGVNPTVQFTTTVVSPTTGLGRR